jgi:integrase
MSMMKDILRADGAQEFLDDIGTNSKSSKTTFACALTHFQNFLDTKRHTLRSIIKPLATNEINVYELLNCFKNHIMKQHNGNDESMSIGTKSINVYMSGVRSYLAYYDIDIIPTKFKKKVKMPKIIRQDEEAIDAPDIRDILLHTNNRRLKPYLLILASAGPRTIEAASLRLCELDDLQNNTIKIRGEFTKTKQTRYTFISDEAVKSLNEWIAWKYRERRTAYSRKTPVKKDTDLVFAFGGDAAKPKNIYEEMRREFHKVLIAVNKDRRKDNAQRHKITLNSFRRFVKTTVADHTNSDYSEWFIGHAKSSYWTKKEPEKRKIYATKCMKYLTFLDYSTLEATGKNIEAKMSEKDIEIQAMKTKHEQDIKAMREEMENKFQQILTKIDIAKVR